MSIRDAIRALTGRLPKEYVRWEDLDRIEQRLLDWEATITTTLERLNAWYARESKRQRRQLEKQADALEAPPTSATPAPDPQEYKKQLRARVFGGAHPAVRARRELRGVGPNVDGDQGQ